MPPCITRAFMLDILRYDRTGYSVVRKFKCCINWRVRRRALIDQFALTGKNGENTVDVVDDANTFSMHPGTLGPSLTAFLPSFPSSVIGERLEIHMMTSPQSGGTQLLSVSWKSFRGNLASLMLDLRLHFLKAPDNSNWYLPKLCNGRLSTVRGVAGSLGRILPHGNTQIMALGKLPDVIAASIG